MAVSPGLHPVHRRAPPHRPARAPGPRRRHVRLHQPPPRDRPRPLLAPPDLGRRLGVHAGFRADGPAACWTRARWRGTWCRRGACSRSWPSTGRRCSRSGLRGPVRRRRGRAGRRCRPTRMAAVLTLQVLHDYSDRETAEAVRFDVRWKTAIGVPLDDPGFDPSTLVYWRNADREPPTARTGSTTRWRKVVAGDRDPARPAPRGGGLHDPGRRGGHPGHRHPAGGGDPQGGPGGARRGGADRGGVHRARLQQAGQAEDRLGRPGREGRAGVGTGQRREGGGGRAGRAGAWRERGGVARWRCWRWSPGRTWSRPRAATARDGRWRIARKVAGDRVISTVDPEARHTRKSPRPAATGTGRTWPPSRRPGSSPTRR